NDQWQTNSIAAISLSAKPRNGSANSAHSVIAAIEDITFELGGPHVFRNVWVRYESLLFMSKSNFPGKTVQWANRPRGIRQSGAVVSKAVEKAISEGTRLRWNTHT